MADTLLAVGARWSSHRPLGEGSVFGVHCVMCTFVVTGATASNGDGASVVVAVYLCSPYTYWTRPLGVVARRGASVVSCGSRALSVTHSLYIYGRARSHFVVRIKIR